jgi:hypothetical protein
MGAAEVDADLSQLHTQVVMMKLSVPTWMLRVQRSQRLCGRSGYPVP